MSMSIRAQQYRRLIRTSAVMGAALVAVAASSLAIAQERPDPGRFRSGSYVVVLAEQPAATYRGGIAGLAATAAEGQQRFKAGTSAVHRYRDYLLERQQELADSVGADLGYHYTVALNGFSAQLSADQVAALDHNPNVLAVVKDTARPVDTVNSPNFLGLSGPDGVWESLGGPGNAGRGVVVGVIDTGIWPENRSFAGNDLPTKPSTEVGKPYRTSDTETAMVKANGDMFTGVCEPGENWTATLCNDKLISARYFPDGFVSNVPAEHRGEFEQISARDGDGHGSHTAGTAAGKHGVSMVVGNRDFGNGSGMAPSAKIAVYKVCWEDDNEDTGGCYSSDAVAAIDQAILDGVDVINYSIAGSSDTSVDPVELAFLSAASANIFVAVSAGNSGPDAGTVAHNSPWLTSVAASTHVTYEGTVELGNGRRFRGAMIDDKGITTQTRLLYAGDIAAKGIDRADAALCAPRSLNDKAAAGAIVLCDRGEYPRTDKSAEVARAGGIGSIIANTDPAEDVTADFHVIPTPHVPAAAGAAIRDYAGAAHDPTEGGPTAALLPGDQTELAPTPIPMVAGFSSRGPASAHDGNLLKPDIAAPGVDVLAAVAPGPNDGHDYAIESGTSMASPHIAGLAALIRSAKPDWSAMAMKSALMTTAYDPLTSDGSPDLDHFAAGAGQVDPTRFLQPGLVYESTPDEWQAFLNASENAGIASVAPMDPSNLNQPSIAVGALAGEQRITRRVTAVTPGLYQAQVDVPGFITTVTPSALLFDRAGQTKEFTVMLTRATAPLDTYAQGTLTWHCGATQVRSPIVVRPVAMSAPAEVTGQGPEGKIDYDIVPGVDNRIDVTVSGLVPGEVTNGALKPGESADPDGNSSSRPVEFDVPDGAALARFDLVSQATDADYDLHIYGPDGKELPVDGATSGASEQVDLIDPEPGKYRVLVHLFSTTGGAAAHYSLRSFAVTEHAQGNATASPDPIPGRLGQPTTMTIDYNRLKADVPYLGMINYAGSTTPTIVFVE